ncbi:hypothetical protein [Nonomuraea sp. bgisy101]|uniref:hypothetical protein n=1 Tax=Nonomuraea sp. bgisy101 TaxID=3413784 RepID=UPI003D705E28
MSGTHRAALDIQPGWYIHLAAAAGGWTPVLVRFDTITTDGQPRAWFLLPDVGLIGADATDLILSRTLAEHLCSANVDPS